MTASQHKLADRLLNSGWIALLVLVGGLVVTGGVALSRRQADRVAAQHAFDGHLASLSSDVAARFQTPSYGLNGLRATFASQPAVSHAAFRTWIGHRVLAQEFPGVRGFGFAQHVERAGLASFEAQASADEGLPFHVRTAGDAADLYVIRYLEPLAANRAAWGFDLGSEPLRRAAIDLARRRNHPTLSAPIELLQAGGKGPGYLLILPLPASAPGAAAGGIVYAPVVASELLADAGTASRDQVRLQVFDSGDRSATALFDSLDPAAAAAAAPPSLRGSRVLEIAGRPMTLLVSTLPGFDAVNRTRGWITMGLLGTALSLALALLAHLLASGRARARALARGMTAELQRLATIARLTSNAVIITTPDLRITWVNEGFTRLYGYALDEAVGRTPGELLGSGKTPAHALAALAEAAAAGRGVQVEVLNRTRDGSERWVHVDVQPVRDEHDRLNGFIEIATDIHAQRLATDRLAAAMRESEALINTIRSQTIVSVADRGGFITDLNDAFCQVTGYTREDLLGQNHRILNSGVHPPAFWADMWRTIASGSPWRAEVCNRAKDGSLYWVDSIVAPFRGADGTIEKYVSIRTVITEAKLASQQLARERTRLADVLEGTQVGTWEWNLLTHDVVVDERWAALIGYTVSELAPTTLQTWTDHCHPDDLARSTELIQKHLRGEIDYYDTEFRMRHRAGHWVWIQGRGRVIAFDDQGRPRTMAGTHMDIQQRKLLHEQAAERERFMRLVTDNVPARIAYIDAGGRYRFVNEHRRLSLGRPREAIIGHTRAEILGGAAAAVDAGAPHVAAALRGEPQRFTLVEGAGATARTLEYQFMPDLDADGRVLGFYSVGVDISDRHTMEQALRRTNQVLGSILDSMPCAISVFDVDLRLIAHNAQFKTVLDFPDDLVDGPDANFESIIRFNAARGEYGDGDLEANVSQIVERARHPSAHHFERARPDGRVLEVRGAPMPEGGFVTTYVDVTERRRTEAEREAAQAILRGAIDAVDEAFVLFDPQDRLVICNEKYRALYQQSSDLIVPGARFEDIVREGARRGQYAAAEGRVDEWVAERLALHRAGDQTLMQRLDTGRWLKIIERRMPDGHTVGFRIDITDLMNAREAAEHASEAKSQFLANMSHEIRTPMNAVLGMLRLLARTELSTRQAEYARKAEGAAKSLLALLNDILDFSKVEAGKMSIEALPTDLDPLFGDLADILSSNAGNKPVEVLFDVDARIPPRVVADPLRLKQILINLAGNALKFTERGNVIVSVRQLARHPQSVDLAFAVQDSGIGIAPENQDKIFSGFTQAEASTTRRFGGTGLGLAICRRLITLMGGQLELHSVLGEGSRFSFTLQLPLVDGAPEGAEIVAKPASVHRVLMVDDNPIALELHGAALANTGWQVDAVASGADALARVQAALVLRQPYDTVFVDWQMPGMDGWQTAAAIRRLHAEAQAVPRIVMLTAYGRDATEAQNAATLADVDSFLAKPVTPSMLRDAALGRPAILPALRSREAVAQPLAGMLILVVDDNENNQQIARELLEDEGARVQVAGDGQQGLDAVLAAPRRFDLVLMDVQMPVMDGLTATARIRAHFDAQALPVIAMSANAMASDREASLAAGMNDHVGKPFELAQLIEVIQRHVRRGTADPAAASAAAPGSPAPAAAPTGPGADALDTLAQHALHQGIDLPGALERCLGKTAIYARMLRKFGLGLDAVEAELTQALAAGDTAAAVRGAHSLKGLAAMMGLQGLADLAAQTEGVLRDADRSADAAAVAALGSAALAARSPVEEIARALQALHGTGDARPDSADAGRLRAALVRLQGLLRDSDMGALDAFEALRPQLDGATRQSLAALDAAVSNLDFDQAIRLCEDALRAVSLHGAST